MSTFNAIIAGATGLVGFPTARAFLNPAYYPKQITSVKFITRDANSEKAKALIAEGAQAIVVEGTPTAETFKGADVFVSAIGGFDMTIKNEFIKAAAEAGVKVYFPSAYGFDPRPMEIPHPVWAIGGAHVDYAKELGKPHGMKVICLFNGSFIDMLTRGWGFDLKNKVFKAFGNPDGKQSLTAVADVGNSIVRLAILAIANPDAVSDYPRIYGQVTSLNDMANTIRTVTGQPVEVQITSDPEVYKANLIKKGVASANIVEYVSWIAGTGATDYTNDNDNELVNPGQTLWKWVTVEQFVKEHKEAFLA